MDLDSNLVGREDKGFELGLFLPDLDLRSSTGLGLDSDSRIADLD